MNKLDLSKMDLMINDSLLIIYNSEYGMVYSDSFVDENGMKLNRYNGDSLGRIMEERGLVKKNGQFYELKNKGIEIVENVIFFYKKNEVVFRQFDFVRQQ